MIRNLESGQESSQEQTPEQIREIIEGAIEAGKNVLILQETHKGGIITNVATPIEIKGSLLQIEADGYGFEIELDKIKAVQVSGE